jgi:hypothetical protein
MLKNPESNYVLHPIGEYNSFPINKYEIKNICEETSTITVEGQFRREFKIQSKRLFLEVRFDKEKKDIYIATDSDKKTGVKEKISWDNIGIWSWKESIDDTMVYEPIIFLQIGDGKFIEQNDYNYHSVVLNGHVAISAEQTYTINRIRDYYNNVLKSTKEMNKNAIPNSDEQVNLAAALSSLELARENAFKRVYGPKKKQIGNS